MRHSAIPNPWGQVLLGLSVLTCCLLTAAASAQHQRALDSGEETTIIPSRDLCSGTLAIYHDSSFETGWAWEGHGNTPEYYGAWGEAFDFGPCQVVCGAYWLTTLPTIYHGDPVNLYVWEGGVTREPGAVLLVVPDVYFPNIPFWPQIGANEVSVEMAVEGEFTIGFWGHWDTPIADFFIAVDQNGNGGHPWTYVAPGLGYTPGWHHPSEVWATCRSLGIGVYYDLAPTPVGATSWSRLKQLYR